MPKQESEYYVADCGNVKWGMRRDAGYKGGLEQLEENESFKKIGGVYWFCRDVAISICAPGNEQCNVVTTGQKLVEEGQLTQQELDYVYGQFGFDQESYTPPDLEAQARHLVEALNRLNRTQ